VNGGNYRWPRKSELVKRSGDNYVPKIAYCELLVKAMPE
jgi:hypothetical protein